MRRRQNAGETWTARKRRMRGVGLEAAGKNADCLRSVLGFGGGGGMEEGAEETWEIREQLCAGGGVCMRAAV
jgi:hypothetical protein